MALTAEADDCHLVLLDQVRVAVAVVVDGCHVAILTGFGKPDQMES